jgi:sulfur carrier protein
MKIFIEKTNQEKQIRFKGTASALLKELNINPETILIVKNNEVITEDEQLSDKDDIKLLSIISGG